MDQQLTQKLIDMFDKLQLTQDERDMIVLTIGEQVAKNMDNLVTKIMVEEDYIALEKMDDEDEANEYIRKRFVEETGEDPQKVSDDLTREIVEQLQLAGIQELLNRETPEQ